MGQELPFERRREIYVDVTGWDDINRIEVLKNNEIIHRQFPKGSCASNWKKPVILRLEYGWGRFTSEDVYNWDMEIEVDGGKLIEYMPGFQSGPYEEIRRDRISNVTPNGLCLESFTSRRQGLREVPTKNIALKLQANPDTVVNLKLQKPSKMVVRKKLSELAKGNDVISTTKAWSSPSFIIGRLAFADNYKSRFLVIDTADRQRENWYYVRVVQENGQLAFSSPIWVG
ncbi:unnamed protein product [marine sediment metagenome]|uniref:Uncharacterized protein n=1 Tax=marine sediment metagenome TaxID=412755 RepID=X0W6H0_9ZZZZ